MAKAAEAVCGSSITTFLADQQIWLMTLYGKDEAEDLTPQEKKVLRSAIEAELRTREAKRLALEKRLRRKP